MSDRINLSVPIVEVKAPRVDGLLPTNTRAFMMNGCSIMLSHEGDAIGWHLSIARRDRDPTWDEIATARYRLCPDVIEMVMPLPRLSSYVNLNPHCFHLYEDKIHRTATWPR